MAPDPGTAEEKAAVAEAGTMHEPNPLDGAAPPSSMPPSHPDAALDPPEIAALIERGRRYFEAGDLAAARLVFGRAANAGDASAALAMGATYDPTVLANRFIRGMGADLDKARSWYEKARELGSPEGPRRLEMLAHR
jgi:TPR repeat protein